MEPGDVVTIYFNPVTQKRPEGKAKLIAEYRADTGDGLSMWCVEFLNEPDQRYLRTIKEEAAR